LYIARRAGAPRRSSPFGIPFQIGAKRAKRFDPFPGESLGGFRYGV
jgi:hypothetical protein